MLDDRTETPTGTSVAPVPVTSLVPTNNPSLADMLEELHADRDMFDRIRPERLRTVARQMNRSERTVRRRLDELLAGRNIEMEQQPYVLTDEQLTVVAAHAGNVAAAHDDLLEAGHDLPSLTTFWRGFQRVPSDVRGYILGGNDGMMKGSLFLRWEPECRNDVWEIDHKEVPVEVLADGCAVTKVKPWLTAIIDAKTRRVMAWSLTADVGQRPDAEVVCAVLAEAMMLSTDGTTKFGGMPTTVRCDQGAEFIGTKLAEFSNRAGFQIKPVMAYSGHLKGKIERLFRTLDTQFSSVQPGYTEGPKTLSRKEPLRTHGDSPVTANELRRRLGVYFARYNDHAHSSLDGRTPNEVWAAETSPLQQVSAAVLRDELLLAPKTPKLTTNGLNFAGLLWVAPELHGRKGEEFQLRFPIFHHGFVEVYDSIGEWVCTATQQLDRAQRDRMRSNRKGGYHRARNIMNAAAGARVHASDDAAESDDPTPHVAAHLDDPFSHGLDDLHALTGLLDDIEPAATHTPDDGDGDGGDGDGEERREDQP